jgi:spermidine synthase
MRIDAPDDLELDYTRTMMAFLLFHPRPRDCMMIGLGGGSIPKFLFRRLPGVRTRVVELNPAVITAARSLFNVPNETARLRIELGDGAAAVHAMNESCDLLFVDGFVDGDQVPALVSDEFYAAAYEALRSPGVLVVNFFGHDRKFNRYLQRIEAAFDESTVCLNAREDGNIIVFALKGAPASITWDDLRRSAERLEQKLGLPFGSYVSGLRKMNRWTRKALLIAPDSV